MRRAASGFLLLTALAVAATAGLRQWREFRESGLTIRWDEESGLFDWGSASVRLPSGFLHRRLQGCDTLMGEFISPGGRVIVNYDIGELAGEHGGIGAFAEVLRGGSRVRLSRSGEGASFPDNGCARFSLNDESPEGLAAIHAIAASFQPRNRLPDWLVPLLPEAIRKDCRYRFPGF